MTKNPTVSVCMITYGHEKYIKQAIEGVLMQVCDFEVELVIADDCSPDNTYEIIKGIEQNHPNGSIINYTKHVANKGMMPNFIWTLNQCQGKYIAICEGDDYWTDPLKLQKQISFLEQQTDVNICFTRAQILKNDNLSLHKIPKPFCKDSFNYIELIRNYNFIATASVIFRKPNNLEFPKWFSKVPFGDLSLYKLIAQNKKIQCIGNEIMTVYRVHDKGAYSGLSKLNTLQTYLSFYRTIFSGLNEEEQKIVSQKIKEVTYKISRLKYPNRPWFQKVYKQYLILKA